MRRAARIGAVAAIALAAAATWSARRSTRAPETAASAPPRGAIGATAVRWTKGTEYRYALRWSARGEVTIAALDRAAPIAGEARLDGELVVRALGDDARGTILEASMARVDARALRVGGSDVLASDDAARAAFDGQRAWGRVDARGAIGEVLFRADAPRVFRRVMAKVIAELGVTSAGDDRAAWEADEDGPSGRAHARYRAADGAIERTRERYATLRDFPRGACEGCAQTLASTTTIAPRAEGGLARLDDRESLDVRAPAGDRLASASEAHFALLATSTFSAAEALDTSALEAEAPIAGADPSVRRALDEAAAKGMTAVDLDALADRIARDGAPIAERGWLSRAAGYLRLHPEAVASLRDRALAGSTRDRDAALVLLAAAGDGAAQRAMRAIAARAIAVDAPADAARRIQRFTGLAHADAASGEWLRDAYAQARGHTKDVARGAAAALGAVAGDLGSRDLVAELERDLTRATDADDKRALVLALANTGDASEEPRVRALASDANPAVRAEVASSLRGATTDESRATLLALLADPQPAVAAAALRAIAAIERSARDDALASAVADRVLAGAVARGIEGALFEFLAAHATDRARAAQAVEALIARADDPELRGRMREWLGRAA